MVSDPRVDAAATASTPSSAMPHGAAPIPGWADTLTRLLDDAIRVPGTKLGIGLDAIIGFLVPVLGDAATAVASLALLLLALQRGIPRVVLGRMIMNIAIDALVGAVPIVGDLFDVAWKANRKNLELIRQHEATPYARPRVTDYLIVGAGIGCAVLAIALPIVLATLLARSVLHRFH